MTRPAAPRPLVATARLLCALPLLYPLFAGPASAQSATDATLLERGRYMIVTGQCNNCHTAGYSASQGTLPESAWLLGDRKGRREPEGTVYATNLRHFVSQLTLAQWIVVARNGRSRAPMPWWNLAQTRDEDLAAMYAYIRSLQPVGEPVPEFKPAGQP
jgi:mono/diheme cytochrome c family protein